MKYPKTIKPGDKIGFVSPSFGCAREPYFSTFKRAVSRFEEDGYRCDIGPNAFVEKGIGISNSPKLCAAELNDYYCRDDIDALISCGGGELMCETIPFMDFERMKKADPKWYLGYSDNTNFTYFLTTVLDTAAIYGPCVSSFGMDTPHQSLKDAFGVMTGQTTFIHNYDKWEKESFKSDENPFVPYNLTEETIVKGFKASAGKYEASGKVDFSGRLIGGCLDCLINLKGTRFDHTKDFIEKYKDDGIIWFIEACELNLMSIRRAIWQLKESGWFDYVKGFLIGRPMMGMGVEEFGIDHYRAFLDLLAEYNVPALMDLDIGHLPPMMPVISGAYANVHFEDGSFRLDYEFK